MPWQKISACYHVSQNLYLHEMDDILHIDRILLWDIATLRLDDPRAWWSHFEVMRQMGALLEWLLMAGAGMLDVSASSPVMP